MANHFVFTSVKCTLFVNKLRRHGNGTGAHATRRHGTTVYSIELPICASNTIDELNQMLNWIWRSESIENAHRIKIRVMRFQQVELYLPANRMENYKQHLHVPCAHPELNKKAFVGKFIRFSNSDAIFALWSQMPITSSYVSVTAMQGNNVTNKFKLLVKQAVHYIDTVAAYGHWCRRRRTTPSRTHTRITQTSDIDVYAMASCEPCKSRKDLI